MILSAAIALACTAAPSQHGLDLSLVPADTPFLVHLDVQAFRETRLCDFLLEHQAGGNRDLEEVEREYGLHPVKDLLAVTVFSVSAEDTDTGVVVLRTTDRLDTFLERVAEEEVPLRTVQHGGLELLALEDEGFAWIQARGTERLVVASDDPDRVLAAVEVLRGLRPSLAQTADPELGATPGAGTYLFVEVGDSLGELTGHLPSSEVGRGARHLVLEMGERGGRTFLSADVELAGDREAKDVGSILEGAAALARMAGSGKAPEAVLELLDGLQVQVDGTHVRMSLEFDAPALAEELEGHGR